MSKINDLKNLKNKTETPNSNNKEEKAQKETPKPNPKKEGTPKGEVTSVMAQDLEKSDIGKQMVIDTPDGKMVNYAQGMAPLFAAIAELNKRTKKLEGSKE